MAYTFCQGKHDGKRVISQRDDFPSILYSGSGPKRIKTQMNKVDMVPNLIKDRLKSVLTFQQEILNPELLFRVIRQHLKFLFPPSKISCKKLQSKTMVEYTVSICPRRITHFI